MNSAYSTAFLVLVTLSSVSAQGVANTLNNVFGGQVQENLALKELHNQAQNAQVAVNGNFGEKVALANNAGKQLNTQEFANAGSQLQAEDRIQAQDQLAFKDFNTLSGKHFNKEAENIALSFQNSGSQSSGDQIISNSGSSLQAADQVNAFSNLFGNDVFKSGFADTTGLFNTQNFGLNTFDNNALQAREQLQKQELQQVDSNQNTNAFDQLFANVNVGIPAFGFGRRK